MDTPLYYRSLYSQGPSSFLFYIVARIGSGGDYRPLAVASRTNDSDPDNEEFRGSFVPNTCFRVIRILCSPSNRIAIEAERSLADSFYKNNTLERVYPAEESEISAWDILEEAETVEESQYSGHGRKIPEFPFLSTCLLVGLSYDASRCRTHDARLEPLGVAFQDVNMANGMVVIDVSELDSVRYGIVAFTIHHMANIRLHPSEEWDPAESIKPEDEPELVLEEERLRIPLSAVEYMDKFRYVHNGSRTTWFTSMEAIRIIDTAALNFIWPGGDVNNHPTIPQFDISTNTLGHQAVKSLINSTKGLKQYDMSIFATSLEISGFQVALRHHIDKNPESLGPSVAAGQLLSLAYDGCRDLIWTPFKNLSFEAVAISLESPRLQKARSLALCIDRMQGDVDVLLRALCARLDALQQVCFLQDPSRTDDEASIHIFIRISTNPEFSQMLQSNRIMATCSYSMPIQRKAWLPTSNYTLPPHVYPVQQMFVRHRRRLGSNKFWPNYFYLGDGLFEPESFAFGFLNYLGSICSDEGLIGFSSTEPTIKGDTFNARIGPLLGEVSAIPLYPIKNQGYVTERQIECWSKPRDLVPSTWTVLVSCELAAEPSYKTSPPTIIRYAFVQVLRYIVIDVTTESIVVRPGDVKICTVNEFVQATCRHIDDEVVQKRIDQISEIISAKRFGSLPHSQRWISVFDDATAISVLQDFLEDARFICDGLRFTRANQKQENRNWYPELLQGTRDEDVELPKRRSQVFEALSRAGV